jgi:hypothetical protein
MDKGKKFAYIIAYYLSKFDDIAVRNLGFLTDTQAFRELGKSLNILPAYIRFRRDEFDVVHPHRKGWTNRPMTSRTANTILMHYLN